MRRKGERVSDTTDWEAIAKTWKRLAEAREERIKALEAGLPATKPSEKYKLEIKGIYSHFHPFVWHASYGDCIGRGSCPAEAVADFDRQWYGEPGE